MPILVASPRFLPRSTPRFFEDHSSKFPRSEALLLEWVASIEDLRGSSSSCLGSGSGRVSGVMERNAAWSLEKMPNQQTKAASLAKGQSEV